MKAYIVVLILYCSFLNAVDSENQEKETQAQNVKTVEERLKLLAEGVGYSSVTLVSAYMFQKILRQMKARYYCEPEYVEAYLQGVSTAAAPFTRNSDPALVMELEKQLNRLNEKGIYITCGIFLLALIGYANYKLQVPIKAVEKIKAAIT
jgi:hypothetical protein